MPVPEEIQDLIAAQSFTVAYKLQKYKLAGKLRQQNPVSLEFLFRIADVQKRITVLFDGQWRFDDNNFWLKFKSEELFKSNLVLLLNKRKEDLETKIGRHYEDSLSIYLKYPPSQTFLVVCDVLLDYIPIHHKDQNLFTVEKVSEYINEYIECVDFPAKLNCDKKMTFRRKLNGNFTLVICHNNVKEIKVYKVFLYIYLGISLWEHMLYGQGF